MTSADPHVDININGRTLSPPPRGLRAPHTVVIFIDAKSDEILVDPTTGQQTLSGRSTPVDPPVLVDLNLPTSNRHYIQARLWYLLASHGWLCETLASRISTAATSLGFSRNGFTITVSVTVTYYHTVVVTPDPLPQTNDKEDVILRKVLLGRIRREELESLEMEAESCSICLEDLCGGGSSRRGVSTRMDCSHVFHDRCLLEWLRRKNTCPLCRTELYD